MKLVLIITTVVTAAVAIAPFGADCISVPKLDTNSDWFLIESEQTTQVSPEMHFGAATWLVSDYFSFKAKVAFSVHKNKDTGQEYELISLGHRHYFVSQSNGSHLFTDNADECHLDSRHDHSTLFPWRHAPPNQFNMDERLEDSFHLIGVGALWMNLADDKLATCQLIGQNGNTRAVLRCRSSKRRESTWFELDFEQPTNKLDAARVTRLKSVSHDQWTILEEIKQVVRVTRFEKFAGELPMPMMRHRIDQLRMLCESVHESSDEMLFPSLVRQLANSEQRAYHLSYELKLYEQQDGPVNDSQKGATQKLIERQSVQEWFSFKLGMQTFVRNIHHTDGSRVAEGLVMEKLMRLFEVVQGSSVNYAISLASGHSVLCRFATSDDDLTLSSISRLMRRPVRLASHKFQNLNAAENQGELIGLGALLMNAADIKHKRQLTSASFDGDQVISVKQESYAPYIVWVLSDFKESKQRFYFYFKKRSSIMKPSQAQSDIGDLFRIELRRRAPVSLFNSERQAPLGGLDDDERIERDIWQYQLVMAIAISDFATWLYPDELLRAFTVPPNCPPASELIDYELNGPDDQLPDQDEEETRAETSEPNDEPAGQQEFSFPASGCWHVDLEQNYKISSTWSAQIHGSGRQPEPFKVVEYLLIDQDNWASLHARIDIIRQDQATRFVLDYTQDLIYRIENDGKVCQQVSHPDDWLQTFSSEMHLAGYQQISDSEQTMRHFGLGGLWELASWSSFVDLIYVGPADTATGLFKTIWSLRDDPQLAALSRVYFTFMLRPDRELAKLPLSKRERAGKLESVTVDSDGLWKLGKGVRSVVISDIQLEPGKTRMEDFKLPPSCRPLAKRERQFPTLARELQKKESATPADIAETSFELNYDLHWSSETRYVTMQVGETNLPNKLRLCEIDLLSTQGSQLNLAFWSSPELDGGIAIDYQPRDRARICKRSPPIEDLFGFGATLRSLTGGPEPGQFAGLPLTNLWLAFEVYLKQAGQQVEVKTTEGKFKHGDEHEHTTWSLNTDSGSLVFETRPGLDQEERLASVSITTHDPDSSEQVSMSFRLKRASPIERLDRAKTIPVLPSACRAQDGPGQTHWGQFPSLAALMVPGRRLYMRSEIRLLGQVSSDTADAVGTMESYFVHEWLQYGEAYRSKCTMRSLMGGGEPRSFDQLIYPATKEYFDLTRKYHCPTEPNDIRAGEKKRDPELPAGSFIGESLFYSDNKVCFHGPIALWLLCDDQSALKLELLFNGEAPGAGNSTADPSNKLHLLDLSDERRLEDWLLIERWLATHRQFGEFVVAFTRPAENHGLHEVRLETARVSAPNYRLAVEMINYKFEQDPNNFELFDAELRIPVGFGCSRSELAKKQLSFSIRDYLVFEELNPFEFYYEASLALNRGHARLETQPVFNQGRLMRCPENWTAMSVGKLRVNRHELRCLDGRSTAFALVTGRDFSSAARTVSRLTNELDGSCMIHLEKSEDSSDDEKMLALTFDDQIIELTMSMLKDYFQSMAGFERIQEFQVREGGDDGHLEVVYEARRDSLKLNEQLSGPGSIVRTFRRLKTDINRVRDWHHMEAKIEIIIAGKAHLSLRLNRLRYIECREIILAAQFERCYQESQSASVVHEDTRLSRGGTLTDEPDKRRDRRRFFEMIFEARLALDDTGGQHNKIRPAPAMTIQEFDLNQPYLEHDFQRVFFTPPDRIPVSQLGRFSLKFSAADSKLVAAFSLIEPVSLLHEFERVAGSAIDFEAAKKLRAVGVDVQRRPVRSTFKCAELCESRLHSCLAFSHCSDRSCTFLQVHDWPALRAANPDQQRQVGTVLKPVLGTNSLFSCTLYHWIALDGQSERLYIDEIVDLIRGQVAKPEDENKFTLVSRITTSKRAVRTKFKAVELIEVTKQVDDNGDGGGEFLTTIDEKQKVWSEFAVLADRSELNLAADAANLATAKALEASDLAACLGHCSMSGCQLVSYCSVSRVCSLVAGLTQWSQFEAMAAARHADRNHCVVYSWDYTRLYELFDKTGRPSEFAWRETLVSVNECAARCHLEPECLSFDFCIKSPSGQPEPTCYGQRSHVSFDGRLLPTAGGNKSRRAKLSSRRCAHYSKLVLTDFDKIKGEKFAGHKSFLFHDASLEHCAAVCRRDASCRSFEYCAPEKRDSTCYIEERPLRSTASNSTSDPDSVATISQEDCSIYALKGQISAPESEQVEGLAQNTQAQSNPMLYFGLVATTFGFVFGMIYRQIRRLATYLE